jgi:hypothetical protein
LYFLQTQSQNFTKKGYIYYRRRDRVQHEGSESTEELLQHTVIYTEENIRTNEKLGIQTNRMLSTFETNSLPIFLLLTAR